MTEPSQYFKGRTVQEQMNEVIGYVDARAEEVAAAKADDVLEPAEQAKDDAIAAKEAAEQARDTTLAALPQIQQDITDLKAEDVALDGRLDTVELKVQTAEGNIVTIQGRVTAVETKNTQQDSAIAALQTADGQNVKINNINQYAVGLTGNQAFAGEKKVDGMFIHPVQKHDFYISAAYCCLLEYSGRMQIMFDLYTYKGTGSGVIDTVTSSEARGGVTLLDPAGWWTSNTNEFFVLLNANTGKYEVWARSTTAVSILIRAIKTYGTPRNYDYVTFHDGSTQSADPRTDTSTYPASEVQIPVMTVRGV